MGELASSAAKTVEEPETEDEPPAEHERKGHGVKMRQDTFTLDEGIVTMQWPETLSQASFEDLRDWLEIMGRKIERAATKTNERPEEE